MKVNKIFLVICFVLFFLLLFWPVLVTISYIAFAGLLKTIFIITPITIEIANGAFLLVWLITNRNNLKTWVFIVGTGIIGILYLLYLASLVYVYIIPY